jgi:hypothetical protein
MPVGRSAPAEDDFNETPLTGIEQSLLVKADEQ